MAEVPFQRLLVLLLLLFFCVSAVNGAESDRSAGRPDEAERSLSEPAAGESESDPQPRYRDPDPWIGLNRGIHRVNDRMDSWILRPIARGYHWVVPDPVEDGVSNFFDNLQSPGIALNQILQGKPGPAANDLGRFLVNTTLGIGGLFDVASRFGMPQHEEDFGQTLAVWGIPEGPFFMIPVRGPSTVTYAVGMIGDAFTNPIGFIDNVRVRNSLYGLYFIDLRARLLSAEDLITGDEYLFIRDAYLQ
ncbi:MAG: VacJ family lipoprotein, partial [Pseudomonadales bacterium]|nr:VacJ family lipoprotein [Pseudomonadales bacterium]